MRVWESVRVFLTLLTENTSCPGEVTASHSRPLSPLHHNHNSDRNKQTWCSLIGCNSLFCSETETQWCCKPPVKAWNRVCANCCARTQTSGQNVSSLSLSSPNSLIDILSTLWRVTAGAQSSDSILGDATTAPVLGSRCFHCVYISVWSWQLFTLRGRDFVSARLLFIFILSAGCFAVVSKFKLWCIAAAAEFKVYMGQYIYIYIYSHRPQRPTGLTASLPHSQLSPLTGKVHWVQYRVFVSYCAKLRFRMDQTLVLSPAGCPKQTEAVVFGLWKLMNTFPRQRAVQQWFWCLYDSVQFCRRWSDFSVTAGRN